LSIEKQMLIPLSFKGYAWSLEVLTVRILLPEVHHFQKFEIKTGPADKLKIDFTISTNDFAGFSEQQNSVWR